MDAMQELYDAHIHSSKTEEILLKMDKDLLDFIESNIDSGAKSLFLDTVESVIKNRDQYFFRLGFSTARELLMK